MGNHATKVNHNQYSFFFTICQLTKDIAFNSNESNANFVKYSEVNTDDLRAAVIGWGATMVSICL
jgi:hypothetical protein